MLLNINSFLLGARTVDPTITSPAPLGIGTVELHDVRTVKGSLCETAGPAGAREITALGGWHRHLETARPSPARIA